MGQSLPPYYGESKFYENKREKLIKQIKELEMEVQICDEKIAEIKNKIANREVL